MQREADLAHSGVDGQVGAASSLECDYQDIEQVHEIASHLLRTTATSCVEKVYGDLFKSPLSVLDETKKELVDYLQTHSHFLTPSAPSCFIDGSSPSPLDRAKRLLDEFVRSKTKILSRVSSKLGNTEKKEEKIEEFERDLQKNERWIFSQREHLAKDLLKALDCTRSSLCVLSFISQKDLAEHKSMCPFRPITCENNGCGHVFSALNSAEHDAVCGFKLLPCEQECGELIMRCQMGKHFATMCSMRLIKCPFFHVGCGFTLPQGMLDEHCMVSVGLHLNSVLQTMQKQQVAVSSLTQRISLLERSVAINQRSEAVDVGSLSLTVQEQATKIKCLESEAGKLCQELKSVNTFSEVEKLRSELQLLQKKVGK